MTETSGKEGQYARKAVDWSNAEYADAHAYLAHRAQLIATLGVALDPGDEVLDLACGDGGLGEHLLARGLRYAGVDAEPAMVGAARRRLGSRAVVGVGDLNTFVPPTPVAATTVFRAIYYAHDRAAFFARTARFSERKLVFDLNPRQYRVADVVAELEEAGYGRIVLHPFFVPQTQRLPGPVVALAKLAEHTGPLARLVLRARFTYLVAACR
ncbi:MAG: class I SAM-dependent methyltransferase [Gaiella sp.]|nr:class I SAM-dependent methyltransferase [Gaiella sp.]